MAGGTVYLEPEALVNWVTPPPLAWSELPYFMLRWSDAWNRASLRHFRQKWRLVEGDPNSHYEFLAAGHLGGTTWPLSDRRSAKSLLHPRDPLSAPLKLAA